MMRLKIKRTFLYNIIFCLKNMFSFLGSKSPPNFHKNEACADCVQTAFQKRKKAPMKYIISAFLSVFRQSIETESKSCFIFSIFT